MMKFKYDKADVLRVSKELDVSKPEAARWLKKGELVDEVRAAKENHDPGRLADVVLYLVDQL